MGHPEFRHRDFFDEDCNRVRRLARLLLLAGDYGRGSRSGLGADAGEHGIDFWIGHEGLPDESGAPVLDHYDNRRLIESEIHR
jgi:hypothetical protein